MKGFSVVVLDGVDVVLIDVVLAGAVVADKSKKC